MSTTSIPRSHPRYQSLLLREKLAEGYRKGLVHETGLIAHGRGEAFDYLIGEETNYIAEEAAKTAASLLLLAKHPVLSINGNVAALVPEDCIKLSTSIPAIIEVNLFHRTIERIKRIIQHLEEFGAEEILGLNTTERIPGLEHDRGWCEKEGIYKADVILVPLEDGDRCEALKAMGKKVITIDLNPLSRTSQKADITIVDNVTRALKNIRRWVIELKKADRETLKEIVDSWDNKTMLHRTLSLICERLNKLGGAEER